MTDSTQPIATHTGFFPFVSAETVDMTKSGALAVLAGGDVSMTQGGAQILLVGGDAAIDEGGCKTLISKGDITVRDGGALVAAGAKVRIQEGWVGIAIGARVDLSTSRVLLGPLQALSLGAGFGIAAMIIRRCFNRP